MSNNLNKIEKKLKPVHVLSGREKDGYGLNWNPNKIGELLCGGEDFQVRLWDIENEKQTICNPDAHTGPVGDVSWNPTDSNIFISVGDDGKLIYWDSRYCEKNPISKFNLHDSLGDINCATFQNNMNESTTNYVATGSADQSARIWDLRKLDINNPKPVYMFKSRHHQKEIMQIKFHPENNNILASASADGTFCFWDILNVGKSQTEEEALDGPPELKFIHSGHSERIFDFDFLKYGQTKEESWTVCSCDLDNIVQIWCVGKSFRS